MNWSRGVEPMEPTQENPFSEKLISQVEDLVWRQLDSRVPLDVHLDLVEKLPGEELWPIIFERFVLARIET
jgi:hypothetical protein